MDDFPSDERNCATCQQRYTLLCERTRHKGNNGYIKGSYGEVAGIIYCCMNYVGKY